MLGIIGAQCCTFLNPPHKRWLWWPAVYDNADNRKFQLIFASAFKLQVPEVSEGSRYCLRNISSVGALVLSPADPEILSLFLSWDWWLQFSVSLPAHFCEKQTQTGEERSYRSDSQTWVHQHWSIELNALLILSEYWSCLNISFLAYLNRLGRVRHWRLWGLICSNECAPMGH